MSMMKDLNILQSIMHGELMPWSIDVKSKPFAEKLKAIGDRKVSTMKDLNKEVGALIADLPGLRSWHQQGNWYETDDLLNLYFTTDFPKYHNSITKFYSLLISKVSTRIYNVYMLESLNWNNRIDIVYRTTSLLRSIKTLTKQTHAELIKRHYFGCPDEHSDCVHFTLHYLKLQLIALFFSIQEDQKSTLEEIISLEDFYLLELEEPVSQIVKLYEVDEKSRGSLKSPFKTEQTINFGFKGKTENLKNILNQLNNRIHLLNESKSNTNELLSVLLAKDLIPGSYQIYLECETAVFRDVYDNLKLMFKGLSLKAIERSKIFYSKQGNLLTAQNLSSSKIENGKLKTEIDSIFNQWK